MKTTIKVAMSLLATVLLVTWVSAHGNDHDGNGNGGGGFGGSGGLLLAIAADEVLPVWNIFGHNGVPARWFPVNGNNRRFAVYPVGQPTDQQVILDRSTGLVWPRVAGVTTAPWEQANDNCSTLNLANAMGWRLPGVQELASLLDPANSHPALPTGSGFQVVTETSPYLYWSSTTAVGNVNNAMGVTFDSAGVAADAKLALHRYWCVRGGQGLAVQ
jgi:hypothetical protein